MRVLDTGRDRAINAVTFSPDGSYLAADPLGLGGIVLDLSGGRPPVLLRGCIGPRLVQPVFSDRVLYWVTYQGREGFDPVSGEPVSVGPNDPSVPGTCLGFAQVPTTPRIVTIQGDGVAWYSNWLIGWVPAADGWERAWIVPQGASSGAFLSAAGDRFVQIGSLTSAGYDYALLIHDAATGEIVARGKYPYPLLTRPWFRPDGRQVIAVRGMAIIVWDTLMPRKPLVVKDDTRRKFIAAAYHPSSRYLFTISNDATVSVWDADSWVRVKRFDWHVGRLRSVAVSPDGLLAAAGSDRGRVVVWDVDV